MTGQVSETHVFGPNTVNQFNGSALFYAAVFVPSDPSGALAALPTFIDFLRHAFLRVGAYGETRASFFFPQGRRVFQYQIIDDFSHVRGKAHLPSGFSWLHDNITDLDFRRSAGPVHGAGQHDSVRLLQRRWPDHLSNSGLSSSPEAGFAFNTYGGYVADDWKVNDRLTVSLNLRLESYASPVSATDCFSRLATPSPARPIRTLRRHLTTSSFSPVRSTLTPTRSPLSGSQGVGIAWRPFHSDKTVIRTGAGIFADELPGGLADDAGF